VFRDHSHELIGLPRQNDMRGALLRCDASKAVNARGQYSGWRASSPARHAPRKRKF